MKSLNDKGLEIWFLTGSQPLYGEDILAQVAEQSKQVVATLNAASDLPIKATWKPVLTTPEAIKALCLEASANPNCIGVITWMHTFSPAKMWIGGLNALQVPILHLNTQANSELPWETIDMDFMNLNQAAHGDREHGHVQARLHMARKVASLIGCALQSVGIQRRTSSSRVLATICVTSQSPMAIKQVPRLHLACPLKLMELTR
jgi:L-arabinose isomerase